MRSATRRPKPRRNAYHCQLCRHHHFVNRFEEQTGLMEIYCQDCGKVLISIDRT